MTNDKREQARVHFERYMKDRFSWPDDTYLKRDETLGEYEHQWVQFMWEGYAAALLREAEAVGLLCEHSDDSECYCADHVASRTPCAVCKTRAFLAARDKAAALRGEGANNGG